jgi:GT2 family glycosyltransferase
MGGRKKIGVVIPYFRAPDEIEKCLAALDAQTDVETEVFVRDNSEDNILYTKAVNEGLRKFCYSDEFDFTVVLTQDCFLRPGSLDKLASVLETSDMVGIASPVQYSNEGIEWAGSLEACPWGQHQNILRSDRVPYATYWANGACFLLRNKMVRDIGVMDENMLFVFSDVDLSFTARSRGWDLVVVPEAACDHFLKTSSPEHVNFVINEVKIYDQIYFYNKWLSGGIYKSLAFEGAQLSLSTREKMFTDARHFYEHAKVVLDKISDKRFSHTVLEKKFDYFNFG